jgi:hypothetical protein
MMVLVCDLVTVLRSDFVTDKLHFLYTRNRKALWAIHFVVKVKMCKIEIYSLL